MTIATKYILKGYLLYEKETVVYRREFIDIAHLKSERFLGDRIGLALDRQRMSGVGRR
jgi:hypothetical protein